MSSTWTDRARDVIEKRIAAYGDSEINFNLMAICQDQEAVLREKLEALQSIQGSAAGGDTGTDLAADTSADIYNMQVRLQDELDKKRRWAVSLGANSLCSAMD